MFPYSSDQSGTLPGLVCRALDAPLPGGTIKDTYSWLKIAQLIELFPL